MLLMRTGRRIHEVLLTDYDPLLPLIGTHDEDDTDGFAARMRYQQTKVHTGQPATIPVDDEIVSIVRAQQQFARDFMARQGRPDAVPKYLFLRNRTNKKGEPPYSAATLHYRLSWLARQLKITDSQGRPVSIGKTHAFRHTRATNLLNAGVPLHVVMRHFGHVTPAMTMQYAKTLSETAEREFLRYKKVTADGRDFGVDPSDLYDVLHFDQRADRILPNGWCMLPPKQTCTKGNACLTCDKFVTDVSHRDELQRQLADTTRLIEQRKEAFAARYGSAMPDDNVWLRERTAETEALGKVLITLDQVTVRPGAAVRGAGTPDNQPDTTTDVEDAK